MRYYFAPMEGVTGYIYRNAHSEMFPGIDKYFTPFISPAQTKSLSTKEMRDVQPSNNAPINLIPQILTNNPEHFLFMAEKLGSMGYKEINLNTGCPSRTVVTKNKGSGFLKDPARLDAFFETVFANKTDVGFSLKTRIGLADDKEYAALLAVFRKYPFQEFILHPRLQADLYKNKPHMDAFRETLQDAPWPVVYNGDIFTTPAMDKFARDFPDIQTVMLGRGLIANPALVRQLEGGETLQKEELYAFLQRLFRDYSEGFNGDTITALFRMKEIWGYAGSLFEDAERLVRNVRKANNAAEYNAAMDKLFVEKEFLPRDLLGYKPI